MPSQVLLHRVVPKDTLLRLGFKGRVLYVQRSAMVFPGIPKDCHRKLDMSIVFIIMKRDE
jgi:hypothetical protein